MQSTQDAGTLELLKHDTDDDARVLHGVHMACQPTEPYRTGCGLLLTADDRNDTSEDEQCVVCWNLTVCDICGDELLPRH